MISERAYNYFRIKKIYQSLEQYEPFDNWY